MREWLSREEWCDARLVCRGRVFVAHRAVLASVSPYLRLLLKSHSGEDTPTYIVLPDFDLEAMSAILHYMYNGEVSLPVNKINSFFDIITTLQIFVDPKSLLKVRDKIEDMYINHTNGNLIDDDITDNGISCTTETSKFEKNLIKLENHINLLTKQNIADDGEQHECGPCGVINIEILNRHTSRNALQSHKRRMNAHSENVQAQDEYQGKSSPLRDSPVELCPQSGNGNGPLAPAAVPAITNEDYRNAGSVHAACEVLTDTGLKRGRDIDLRKTETRYIQPNEETSQILNLRNGIFYSKYLSRTHEVKQDNVRAWKDYYSFNDFFNRHSKSENNINSEIRRPSPVRPVPTLLPISSCDKRPFTRQVPPLLNLTDTQVMPTMLHPAYRENWFPSTYNVDSISDKDVHNNKKYLNKTLENGKSDKIKNDFKGHIKDPDLGPSQKKSAFNQVLASPWCPRVPNCYRPQPSKSRNSPQRPSAETQVQVERRVTDEESKSPSNDKNNNVQSSPSSHDLDLDQEIRTNNTESNSYSISAVTQEDDFNSRLCEKALSSPESESCEGRAGAGGARHTCAECGKTFSQLRNYKYHLSVHRGTREFAATCSVCGKYFNDRGYLSSHMKIHRNRKEYECPHCPKSFNQRVAYNMHVRIHTGVKPHTCGECGKAFSRKMLLKQHQRTHSGERPYACSVCDKRFADRSNMTLHMRLHSGLKPFACTLCPKSFTKKHHLKTHLNYHTGDKPYSCPRCHLAFSQSSNMRTHLKKCNVPEPTAT